MIVHRFVIVVCTLLFAACSSASTMNSRPEEARRYLAAVQASLAANGSSGCRFANSDGNADLVGPLRAAKPESLLGARWSERDGHIVAVDLEIDAGESGVILVTVEIAHGSCDAFEAYWLRE
jgi:hypothetical protein